MNQKEYWRIENRQRRLPAQISNARQKLADLLQEADRNGMIPELLHDEFRGDMVAMERYRMRHVAVAGATAGLI